MIYDGAEDSTRSYFSDYSSLMLGKPRLRLNNLKTSLRFPCRGLNPIIDSVNGYDNAAGHFFGNILYTELIKSCCDTKTP